MRDKTQKEVTQDLISKTFQELSSPERPVQRSRTWKTPSGFRYLVQWSNLVLLRYFVRLFTASLPKSEYRRKSQLDDAARSSVRNLEEGWKRANTSTYLEFVGFSQGSLEEVKGDIRDLVEDGFLLSRPGSFLKTLGIDLGTLNKALQSKGELEETKGGYIPITILYPPLNSTKASDLTYEIFIELINKSEYLLRKLVESLENKLAMDKKYYQVEQARIKDKISKR